MELITVIVPIYNTEKFLDRCLGSILNQTYGDLEVLLVNDGSTDKTADVCRRYCEKDRRFHYFWKENGGDSSARNLALQHATGKYVGFVDSDDWIAPDYLESMKKCFDRFECDVVISGKSITDGEKVLSITEPDRECVITKQEAAEHFWDPEYYPLWNTQWNKLYIREKITKPCNTKMTCGMDLHFNMMYFCGIDKIAFNKNHGYYYYRPLRKTIKYPKNTAEQCLIYSDSVRQFLCSVMPWEKCRDAYERFLCGNMCRDACTMAIANPGKAAEELIREFYSFAEFNDILKRRVYLSCDRKYRIVGAMLRKRLVKPLVIVSKMFKGMIVKRG